MEKDKTETERIVHGIVAKEMKSDVDNMKQKLADAESKGNVKEEQVH